MLLARFQKQHQTNTVASIVEDSTQAFSAQYAHVHPPIVSQGASRRDVCCGPQEIPPKAAKV